MNRFACEYCWKGTGYTYEKDNKSDTPADYENDPTVCRHCKGNGLCPNDHNDTCGCTPDWYEEYLFVHKEESE